MGEGSVEEGLFSPCGDLFSRLSSIACTDEIDACVFTFDKCGGGEMEQLLGGVPSSSSSSSSSASSSLALSLK